MRAARPLELRSTRNCEPTKQGCGKRQKGTRWMIEAEKRRQAEQAEKKDMDLVHIDNKPNGTEGL
jgi:hypothetical protein